MIWINGKKLPSPNNNMSVVRQQLVDSARNAKGEVVGTKINRRMLKLDALEWSYLTAKEWHEILVEIEKFKGTLKFYDDLTQKFTTRKVYWGDATEVPLEVDKTGKVLRYKSCKCNIIDMGYEVT